MCLFGERHFRLRDEDQNADQIDNVDQVEQMQIKICKTNVYLSEKTILMN